MANDGLEPVLLLNTGTFLLLRSISHENDLMPFHFLYYVTGVAQAPSNTVIPSGRTHSISTSAMLLLPKDIFFLSHYVYMYISFIRISWAGMMRKKNEDRPYYVCTKYTFTDTQTQPFLSEYAYIKYNKIFISTHVVFITLAKKK